MKQLALIFFGGGMGSVLRFVISRWLNSYSSQYPFGTMTVNITGSFAIGLILGYTLKDQNIDTNINLLIAIGFCGGFTTFSAFAFENFNFLKTGDYKLFLFYSLGSLCLAILAVLIGLSLTK